MASGAGTRELHKLRVMVLSAVQLAKKEYGTLVR
jgi:hypothetical protein